MAAVVIWSIYGFVSKQYMSCITDYFAGFKSLIFFTAIFVLSNANLDFIVLFFDKELFVLLYSVCLEKRKYN